MLDAAAVLSRPHYTLYPGRKSCPLATMDLFEPHETRPSAPDLSPGDRLAFALCADTARTERIGGLSAGGKGKKRFARCRERSMTIVAAAAALLRPSRPPARHGLPGPTSMLRPGSGSRGPPSARRGGQS